LDFSNTTGASGLRAASSPITEASGSQFILIAAAAFSASFDLRSDSRDGLADVANGAVVAEQGDRRAHA